MGLSSLWNKIKESPSSRPIQFPVPAANIDDPAGQGISIESDAHYFMVRMNEMFLTYRRRWARDFEPMVFCSVDFNYAGEKVTQPFLLSPNTLQSPFRQFPEGMLFKEIKMAGLHPFKGGTFGLTLILGRMEMNNHLRRFLKFLQSTSSAFPGSFSTILGNYLKMADIVMDGLEELFDTQDIEPVIGFRKEYERESFKSGFFVLMNAENRGVDTNRFFVKNKSLHYGDSLASSQPYVSDDYVLYSIEAIDERKDSDILPFHSQFRSVQHEVTKLLKKLTEDEIRSIRALLLTVSDAIWMSPDLVENQRDALIERYENEIQKMIAKRQALGMNTRELESEKMPETSARVRRLIDTMDMKF